VTFAKSGIAILSAGLVLAGAAFAADLQFSTPLDPVAFDNSTVKNNVGKGNVAATLSGSTLTVTGNYAGLSSEATGAQVKLGSVMGMPGDVIGTLKVSGGMAGQVSGSIKLTSAQVAGLRKGGLSVVVLSAKAPNGNLWGWLAPNS
jgi:hypothetical protein